MIWLFALVSLAFVVMLFIQQRFAAKARQSYTNGIALSETQEMLYAYSTIAVFGLFVATTLVAVFTWL